MADGQWSPGRTAGHPEEFLPVLDITEPTRQRRTPFCCDCSC